MVKSNIDQRLKKIRAAEVRIYCATDPAIYSTLDVAADGALTFTTTGGTDSDIIIDSSSGTGDITLTGGLKIATSASPLTMTSTAIPVDINTTTSDTSGAQRSMSILQVATVDTRANQTEVLRVTFQTEKESGDWANAIVGRVDYGTLGDAAGGMVAPICSELNYPAKACAGIGGAYYVLDLEMNCPENFTVGTNTNYPNAWINFGIWGNATATANWETKGYLLRLDGFKALAGSMISVNSQTIRCFLENTAGTAEAKYMVFSDVEDIVSLGISGTARAMTTVAPLEIYTTTATITGNINSLRIEQVHTATATASTTEALYVKVTSDVKTGAWLDAIYACVDYSTSGAAHGMAAAGCFEMIPPNSSLARGALYSLDVLMGCGASASWGSAGPVAFMHFENWGTKTHFTANGYLFHLAGETKGAGSLFDDCTAAAASHALKILIGSTPYYIMLQSNVDAT